MSTGFKRPSSLPGQVGRLSLLTLAMLAGGACSLPALATEPAQASSPQVGGYRFAIEQQPLVSALNAFSQVTGWQVGFSAELAQGVASAGVHGSLKPEAALTRLLHGTGLSYRTIGSGNVVIERQTAARNSSIALQQLTVSATRSAQDVSQVPSTVSVKTREQLDRDNVNSIADLARYEPGVSVSGIGQRSGLNGYNIRGIDGERVLTQIDGVAIPDSFFFGPYAQTQRNYVDPEIIKRVEILRGPASVLYGSNAIGGAVSYFTLDPQDIIKPGKDVGARLKTGYSSADESWLTSATVAGRQGQFDGLLHLSQRNGHEQASYGTHSGDGLARTEANPEDTRSTNVLAKLGWDYAEEGRLGLTYERFKNDRDQNVLSAVGGPFNNGAGFGMYRSRLANDTVTRERFGIDHDLRLDTTLADHLKWSLNYQIAKTDQSTEEVYFPFSRTVLRTRDTTYKNRHFVFDAQLDKAFSLADTEHVLTYGTTLKHEKVTGSRSGTGTCLAVGAGCPSIGFDRPTDGQALVSDFPDPTVNTYSLFVQDEIRWNDWTFLPGARYDYTHMKPRITDEFLRGLQGSAGAPPTSIDASEKRWHRVSPKLGVTYAFDEHYTGYGQYAEGFRTPTAKSMYGRFDNPLEGYRVEGNPNLEPEKSKSFEVGLRGNFDAGQFDVAVFYNTYRDFINEDAVQSASLGDTYQANNIRRATIKGSEIKGRIDLGHFGASEGLYAQGSLAYLHGRNDDTGQPLNSVNPLTTVWGLGYEQPHYGGLLSWTLVKRKNRVDDTNFFAPDGTSSRFRTPGYGVLDLSGFYKLTDDLTVNAGLYNLTDKKYWQWDSVRAYDGLGEAGVTQPANLDRLTLPGRNFAINVVWDI
ncbi:TonB-dependent receptor [Pseudomonas cremoricolorata]|uniref:TonB-dependent receptor n=1 Tax=Pseudomonas cremoricolorata TaxID=157783 RepID=A0A089YD40_9PSED|nr:TonB-dependent receptor [Pseudomonas cremoricolorata]AIR89658.1 TonB-dependent receptor [Pseudomonas cremoricolorata]